MIISVRDTTCIPQILQIVQHDILVAPNYFPGTERSQDYCIVFPLCGNSPTCTFNMRGTPLTKRLSWIVH